MLGMSDLRSLFKAIDAKLNLIIEHLAKGQTQMAIDFSKLDAQAAAAVALLNQLAAQIAAIPVSTDPATQAHIDGLTATLAAAVAADTPPAPAPTPVTAPPTTSGS